MLDPDELEVLAAPYGTHKHSAASLPAHLKTTVCPGCQGTKYRYSYLCIQCSGGSRLNKLNPALAPEREATALDIAWAAGFWEGEGSVKASARTSTYTVSVGQKYREPLDKLRECFGGAVYESTVEFYVWNLNGRRGREFMKLIRPYLSPRRVLQLDTANHTWENRHGV